jgi:hypothetical protein
LETAKPGGSEGLPERKAFASRVTKCVCDAFEAIGVSSATQQIVFWNLSVTSHVDKGDIARRPTQFIEGLRAIFGEAAVVVYEYKLKVELAKEFGFTEDEKREVEGGGFADALSVAKAKAPH